MSIIRNILDVLGIPSSAPSHCLPDASDRPGNVQSSGANSGQSEIPEAKLPLLPNHEAGSSPLGTTNPKSTGSSQTGIASGTTDVVIEEFLIVRMTRNGTVESCGVNGTLSLFAGDREHTKLEINTTIGDNVSDFKPEPETDRAQFNKSKTLCLQNKNEDFPASNVLLAKWSVNNVRVPVFINCCISSNGDGFMTVTIEYNLDSEFHGELIELTVQVPHPTTNVHVKNPDSIFEQELDSITVLAPTVTPDSPRGSLEIVAEADTEDQFFPMDVVFEAKYVTSPNLFNTFSNIDVQSVVDRTTSEPVKFTKTARGFGEDFLVI